MQCEENSLQFALSQLRLDRQNELLDHFLLHRPLLPHRIGVLDRRFQFGLEYLGHPCSEHCVVDIEARFIVEPEASHVEVRGTHRPHYPVHDQQLVVRHRRLVLVDFDASQQQLPPMCFRGQANRLRVNEFPRHRNANPHLSLSCSDQRLDDQLVGNEVRRLQVDAVLCCCLTTRKSSPSPVRTPLPTSNCCCAWVMKMAASCCRAYFYLPPSATA